MVTGWRRFALTCVVTASFVGVSSAEAARPCHMDRLPSSEALHVTGRIHFNVNVSDFERARAFYRELGFRDQVAGFAETNTLEVSRGVGLDTPYRIRAELIYLGELPAGQIDLTEPTGRFIDLIQWLEPFRGESPYRDVRQIGISYFSLTTPDLAGTMRGVTRSGGTIAAGPARAPTGEKIAMVRDPDGTLIRLREDGGQAPIMEYVSFNVKDLDCSARFYEALGFAPAGEESVGRSFETAGLAQGEERRAVTMSHRVDGSRIRLNQWATPAPGEPYSSPMNHIGIQRINWASAALEADVVTLRNHGVSFLSAIAPCCEGDLSQFGFIVFSDPDGIYNQLMGKITPKRRIESKEH